MRRLAQNAASNRGHVKERIGDQKKHVATRKDIPTPTMGDLKVSENGRGRTGGRWMVLYTSM